MNTYTYKIGAATLALAMSGLPAVAFAENGDGVVGLQTQVRVQTLVVDASTSASARAGEGRQSEATSSDTQASSTRPSIKGGEDTNENVQEDHLFRLEGTTTPAFTFAQLKTSIEQRKQELDDEDASSTPENRDIMKNANPVRLAVHALLASKDLIGGIGQQVSDIAQQMNDSVATTTQAEAKIHSRGFLTKLLFGGDTTSADVIAQEAAKNQMRIDSLTTLLADATITPEVKATLTIQIAALKDAQTRLQDLAQKEKSAWGLFSWRF